MSADPRHSVDTFDYVIVGAGAAGSILANRLTEDAGTTVCLLEAGPRDWHPYLHIPSGFIKAIFNPAFTWQFSSEPTDQTNGRRVPIPQGRTLGGSTSINGLAYTRGQPADYDGWAAAGNRGWGFGDVLAYFKRSERKIGPGDDDYHGRAGEQIITSMDWIHPVCEAFIAGAAGAGIPHNADYNGAFQEGAGYYQRTIHNGWRQSAARSFLRPIKNRRNLEIRLNARATAIVLDGKRASGIRYAKGGERDGSREVRARREVIVSSGSINTPRLLQLSGIGPAPLLQSLGIPVRHERPAVGENLRDHFSVRMVAKVKNSLTLNEIARGHRLAAQIARWMLGRPNILAVSPSMVHWFSKSREGLNAPDIQGVFTPASYREGYIGMLDNYPGMTCGVWQHRPESTGFVRVRSADPSENPVIQPNYLEHPHDQAVLLGGMRAARKLMQTPELAQFFDGETLPGRDVTSDDGLLGFARQVGVSCYHVMGTARMGRVEDPSTVVDDQLRVHGLDGLRIVDASIMPSMPSGNTCATTMMIAEKGADMIRRRNPPANEPDRVLSTSLR